MASFRAARKPYSRPPPRGDVDGQWQHDMVPTGPRGPRRGPVPATSLSVPNKLNTRLVVTNLHYEITAKDLTAIFGQIGTLVCEPQIRYDRSGRSSGTAIVSFETPAEATRAKKQFDGILAKTQPMSITFDVTPREPRIRSSSAPTTSSLLNRIQKAPLLDRLSKDDSAVGRKPPSGPRGGVGPIRTRQTRGGHARGAAPRPGPGPKKAKTAEELDNELDAFMVDAPPAAQDAEML
ncbi:hypothetical protein FB45DRAFT_909442 [Roridomyces roridus]|uniref:RRM domain-containing protein n=1 Tax=Roridomyces roridus TaxID=1738132 RepID=A0AAD7BZ10_9AGAR|nr:hypothetical protein FB45DRAFT_909442 [Roridomyces roridus]